MLCVFSHSPWSFDGHPIPAKAKAELSCGAGSPIFKKEVKNDVDGRQLRRLAAIGAHPILRLGPVIVAPAFPQDTRVALPRMARVGVRAHLLTLACACIISLRANSGEPGHKTEIALISWMLPDHEYPIPQREPLIGIIRNRRVHRSMPNRNASRRRNHPANTLIRSVPQSRPEKGRLRGIDEITRAM